MLKIEISYWKLENSYRNMKNGFTLVEVLVFVTIFSLFYVVAIATVNVSLRNMKINEHRLLASHYAQELLEWLRGQKEIDWDSFIAQAAASPGVDYQYCFNEDPIGGWPILGNCSGSFNSLFPPIYDRQATLKSVDCGSQICQIDAVISVSWRDFNAPWSVPLKSSFTIWEP